jgi:hypothetical protein
MNAELITTDGEGLPTPYATQTASERRDSVLALARRGTTISNATSAATAADVLRECKGFERDIEDARKAAKEGPLELCRKIDALAKSLTAEVEHESARISALLGAWQKEQKRIADEAARIAREKEQALIREAEDKAAAERERIAAERAALAAMAAQASNELEAAGVQAQVDALNAEAAEASARHVAATEQKVIEMRVAAAGKSIVTPGLSARTEIKFEITDIVALYEAAPFLVILTPNTAALKAAIKGLTAGQSLPGVRHWTEARAIVSPK